METITVRNLRNDYLRVMEMVERGEVIRITRRGEIFARLTPEKIIHKKADWSQSGAATLDRTKIGSLSDQQRQEILHLSRGED